MRTITEGTTTTLELDQDEELQRHVLQSAISRAVTDPNLWSVFLIVTPTVANQEQDMLRELGFTIAGNLQRGAHTFLKLKRHIRTSGEAGGAGSGTTGELAVPMPMLPSSHFEKQAIEQARQSMSKPLSPAKLEALRLMGKQESAPEPESLIFAKLRAEIARETAELQS